MATLEYVVERTMEKLYAQLVEVTSDPETGGTFESKTTAFIIARLAYHEALINNLRTEIAELRKERQPCNKK